jgi:hypothetical protein
MTIPKIDKLVEQARKVSAQRRENIVAQMGRFERLDLDWSERTGDGAVAYDTGHEDENGSDGHVVIVGPKGTVLLGYVWDANGGIKRWTSVRNMDQVCGTGVIRKRITRA